MSSNKKPSRRSMRFFRKCLNRYVLTGICFVVWLIFFDKHNLFTQQKIKQSVHQLQNEKDTYQALLEDAKQERIDVEINKEKIAREKYLMHKDNEEVFIIDQK